MERLTNKRVNGIKTGCWSPSKKEELVQRLAEYEDTGLTPEQMQQLKERNTPMKLNEICGAFGERYECPNCGSSLRDIDAFAGYCKWCGQRVEV